jgi:hypothetical protein
MQVEHFELKLSAGHLQEFQRLGEMSFPQFWAYPLKVPNHLI